MTRTLVTLSFGFLLSNAALAKEDGVPSPLLFSCDATSRIHLALADDSAASSHGTAKAKAKAKAEAIDVATLVTYGKQDERGIVHRTGTRAIRRTCGTLRLEVSGGYFNENTQGELGAAEDYPIIEVFDGKRSLTGPIGVGACDASNTRSSQMVECPAHWATTVTVFKSGGRFVVHMDHAYEEYRTP